MRGFNLSKKNWVDIFFDKLLLVVACFTVVLLIGPFEAVAQKVSFYFIPDSQPIEQPCRLLLLSEANLPSDTETKPSKDSQTNLNNKNSEKTAEEKNIVNNSSSTKLFYCPELVRSKSLSAQQLNAPSSATGLKDELTILSLIFALLSGVILKFVRDASEDIKKQTEAAKFLDKHKYLQFDYLRISQFAKITATQIDITLNDEDENWLKVPTLGPIRALYEYAESLSDPIFDYRPLKSKMNIISVNNNLLNELRRDNKIYDYLKLLVELSQDKHPELAKSARELYNALKRH